MKAKRRSWKLIGLAGLLCCACGCAALQMAAIATSDSDQPALWTPPREATLVLVENYQDASAGDVDSGLLGRYVEQDLKEHNVAPLVDSQKVLELRDKDPDGYRKMSIAEIGRAVGARQVIYINVKDYDMSAAVGSDLLKGKVSALVKVIDSRTGLPRWPRDTSTGEPVSAQTEFKDSQDQSQQSLVRDELGQAFADSVGKLFHSWDPKSDDSDVSPAAMQN